MATTKIWPVRDNLARVVEYAENHLKTANPNIYTETELNDLRNVLGYAASGEKTAKQFYVTGVNCIDEYAYQQMTATKQRFGKTGGNLAYHAYQSFTPDEVTPEHCHKIGVSLAKDLWGDKYEVVVTTHLNTHCVHNHFVINSVSFVDGKKLNNNYAMYFKHLRAESDRICQEWGLSVIANPEKSSGSRWMQQAERRGEPTLYNIIRSDIDSAISQSMTDKQFYRLLRQWGYAINDDPNRKYATIRPPGQGHNIRFKTLGEAYTQQAIINRILGNRYPVIPPPKKAQARQVQLHGNFRACRKYTGFYALYLHYCYLLGAIPKRRENPQRPLSPELRAAVRQMRKISAETRLLCRHRIETKEQLTTFMDSRKQDLGALERERGRVYNRMKSAKTPDKMRELKTERDELSGEIKAIRKELYYAHDIMTRSQGIRRRLRVEQELRARQFRPEQQILKDREKDR